MGAPGGWHQPHDAPEYQPPLIFRPDHAGFDATAGTFDAQAPLMQAGRRRLTCLFDFVALERTPDDRRHAR
jgi:hypothetical protein